MGKTFTHQVVVITGAGGGIGRALALALSGRGARLALLDRDLDGLAGTIDALPAAAREDAGTWACDVTVAQQCDDVIAGVIARFGGIDILINNAGISQHSLASDTSLDVLRRVMNVNFYGSVHCTLAALPSIRARRGMIAVMSSVAGFAPLVGRSAYAASKHALHGWFDTLRSELRGTGTGVMLVCPSFVRTDIDRHALSGDGGQALKDKPLVGDLAAPEAIAEAICDGLARRERQLVPTKMAWSALWLNRIAPSLYERVMLKKQGAAYIKKSG